MKLIYMQSGLLDVAEVFAEETELSRVVVVLNYRNKDNLYLGTDKYEVQQVPVG